MAFHHDWGSAPCSVGRCLKNVKPIRRAAVGAFLVWTTVATAPGGRAHAEVRAPTQAPASLPDAQLRLAHTSPDRVPLDLVIDGRARLFNVPPGATSGYLPILPGKRDLELRSADSTRPLASVRLEIQMNSGARATLFPLRSGAVPGAVLVPDIIPPAAENTAHVRFIHLRDDLPALWVDINSIAMAAQPLRATAFTAVPPGPVTVHVRAVKGGPDIVAPAVTELGVGGAVSMLVLDGVNGQPQLMTVTDRSGRPIAPAAPSPTVTTEAPPPQTARETTAATPSVTPAPPSTPTPATSRPSPSASAAPDELALGPGSALSPTNGLRDVLRALGLVGVALMVAERFGRRAIAGSHAGRASTEAPAEEHSPQRLGRRRTKR